MKEQHTTSQASPQKRRRWPWIIFGVFVLLGITGFVFRNFLRMAFFVWWLTPSGDFAAHTPPPAPDYAKPETWAALPTVQGFANFVPQGVSDSTQPRQADVFFVHPTTYFSRKSWNAPLDDPTAKRRVDVAVVKHQASPFHACCRVFAPRYRQATLAFAFRFEPNGKKAIELAYSDVVRAFQHYLKHWNQGRPFFIASHSQGTIHALRLIEEYIVKSPLQKQLIAAYLVGNPVHLDRFERTLKPLKPCQHAKDIGCLNSWLTLGEKARTVRGYSRLKKYYPGSGYEDVSGRDNLCTNPLSWTTDTNRAAKALHLGAIPYTKKKEPLPRPLVGLISSYCKDGALWISKPQAPGFNRFIFGPDDYHIYDYHLFYMNIRQNALDRVQVFWQAHKAPQKRP